jgi:hypothetical protein
VEVASPLRAVYKEQLVGLLRGQLNNPDRREKPCQLLTRISDENGVSIGHFKTTIETPTDYPVDGIVADDGSISPETLDDIITKLGVDGKLQELEQAARQQPSVTLTMSMSMFPHYKRVVGTVRQRVHLAVSSS